MTTHLPVTVSVEIPLTRDRALHTLGELVMERLLDAEAQDEKMGNADVSTGLDTGLLIAGLLVTTTDEPGGVEDALAKAHRTISRAVVDALREGAPELLAEVRRRPEGLIPAAGFCYQVDSSDEWQTVTAQQVRAWEIREIGFTIAARLIGIGFTDRTKTSDAGATVIPAAPHEPIADVLRRLATADGPAIIAVPEDGQPDGFRILYVEPR